MIRISRKRCADHSRRALLMVIASTAVLIVRASPCAADHDVNPPGSNSAALSRGLTAETGPRLQISLGSSEEKLTLDATTRRRGLLVTPGKVHDVTLLLSNAGSEALELPPGFDELLELHLIAGWEPLQTTEEAGERFPDLIQAEFLARKCAGEVSLRTQSRPTQAEASGSRPASRMIGTMQTVRRRVAVTVEREGRCQIVAYVRPTPSRSLTPAERRIGRLSVPLAILAEATPDPALALEARFAKLHALHNDRDYVAAFAAVQEIVTVYPTNFRAWTANGRIAFEMGKRQEALAAFRRALELRKEQGPDGYSDALEDWLPAAIESIETGAMFLPMGFGG